MCIPFVRSPLWDPPRATPITGVVGDQRSGWEPTSVQNFNSALTPLSVALSLMVLEGFSC